MNDVKPSARNLMALLVSGVGCVVPTGSDVPTTSAGGSGGPGYTISEVNFYTQSVNCAPNTPSGVIGLGLDESLATALLGRYFADVLCNETRCTEPTDFVEGSFHYSTHPVYPGLVGEDYFYGDSARLSAFAGHGAHDVLSFRRGVSTTGQPYCDARMHEDIRLGQSSGADARVGLYAASCVGYAADFVVWGGSNAAQGQDFWDGLGQGKLYQHLGFFDSPEIPTFSLAAFGDRVKAGDSNYDAWFQTQTFATGKTRNQPIVYTVRADAESDEVLGDRHEFANLVTSDRLPTAPLTGPSLHMIATTTFVDTDFFNDDVEASACIDNITQ